MLDVLRVLWLLEVFVRQVRLAIATATARAGQRILAAAHLVRPVAASRRHAQECLLVVREVKVHVVARLPVEGANRDNPAGMRQGRVGECE